MQLVRSQNSSEGDQGIELKQPVHWPTPQFPPAFPDSRNEAKPNKQQEKESLRYPAGLNDVLQITVYLSPRWFE